MTPARWILLSGGAAVAIALQARAAEKMVDGALHSLLAAGNDHMVWVAESRRGTKNNVVTIYYGDNLSPGLLTSPTLPDRVGDLLGLAVDDSEATLLYADHTSTLLTIRTDAAGPNWPGSSPPLAWAGDAVRPDVYAIGEGGDIELMMPTPVIGSRPTTSATLQERRKSRRPATTRPAPGLTLLRMHHRVWEVAAPLPAAAIPAKRCWLAARDGRVHLLWRTDRLGPIECCSFSDGAWTNAKSIPDSARVTTAWACADRVGPVVVLLENTDESLNAGGLRVAWRNGDAWFNSQPLADMNGPIRLDPVRSAVSVARGKLAIVRLDTDGKVELGQSALDGDCTVTWQPAINLGRSPLFSSPSAGLGWIETLTIMVVMSVIVWSRQRMLSTPLALPQTWMIASPGRRLLAGVIDLLPAVMVTAPAWLSPLSEFTILWPRLVDDPQLGQSLIASRVAPPWYLVVAVNSIYCAAWEWLSGTTPGKHLLRCRVISSGGERPTLQQTLIRNGVRMPELGILLVAASSAFLMLAISRNRQRIGDVVAGTFVVTPSPPLARPAAPRQTNSERREAARDEIGV